MLGTHHLALFVMSGLLLNITPGQDTLFIVSRSLSHGRRAGLLSVAGISTGLLVHTILVALGWSALLTAAPRAFVLLKLAGAAYLIYLGVGMWADRATQTDPAPTPGTGAGVAIYRAGLLTNLLNPKVVLFFLAFLPQFVAPSTGSHALSILFLGTVFIVNGSMWGIVLVCTAAAISRRLRGRHASALLLKRTTGTVLVGVGLRLATSR
jgi:threonine/homoserine/homoserine lactone efflux protein